MPLFTESQCEVGKTRFKRDPENPRNRLFCSIGAWFEVEYKPPSLLVVADAVLKQ